MITIYMHNELRDLGSQLDICAIAQMEGGTASTVQLLNFLGCFFFREYRLL